MKIIKQKNVRTPEKDGYNIIFFVPDDFPGTHFLSSGQTVDINLGLSVSLPKGYIMQSMSSPHGHAMLIEPAGGEPVIVSITNISWDVVAIKPGDEAVRISLIKVKQEEINCEEAEEPIQA